MKYALHLAFAALIAAAVPGYSQEPVLLWEGAKTPFLNEGGVDPVEPTLYLYPTKVRDGHTGAAVVICPGGGYGGLAIDHEGNQPAQWLNDQGISAFVLHYRLGSQGYHYPTQLADVQRAIRYVRANAKAFDLDPNRIAVMGFSAGGHLASMAATLYGEVVSEPLDEIDEVSARPDLAILCYPVISMDPEITHGGSRKNLLGPNRVDDAALAESLSSEKNVTEATPPTFLFQTNADTAVPAENAVRFYLALRAKGVPAELHSFQDGPHGVGLFRSDPVLGAWPGLLSNWLRANSFLAPPSPRVALKGEVTLDGVPVSSGALTFYPDDIRQAPTAIRIRRGRFSVDNAVGPVAGKSTIRFEGSIWEETREAEDRTVFLDSLSTASDAPITLDLSEGMEPLRLDFLSGK